MQTIESKTEKQRYTRKEAAQYLSSKLFVSIKPGTLSSWAWKRKRDPQHVEHCHDLKFVKDGYSVYYPKSELDAYVRNRQNKMYIP